MVVTSVVVRTPTELEPLELELDTAADPEEALLVEVVLVLEEAAAVSAEDAVAVSAEEVLVEDLPDLPDDLLPLPLVLPLVAARATLLAAAAAEEVLEDAAAVSTEEVPEEELDDLPDDLLLFPLEDEDEDEADALLPLVATSAALLVAAAAVTVTVFVVTTTEAEASQVESSDLTVGAAKLDTERPSKTRATDLENIFVKGSE